MSGENFEKKDETGAAFPIPCLTRWGTWLDAICYINSQWISRKRLWRKMSLQSSAAAKVCQEKQKPESIKSMGFLSAFEFLK